MINNETKPFVLEEEINNLKNIFTDIDWLGTNHNLYAVALPLIKGKWIYCIYDLLEPFHMHKEEMKMSFNSSQEACSAAISFLLNFSKKESDNN